MKSQWEKSLQSLHDIYFEAGGDKNLPESLQARFYREQHAGGEEGCEWSAAHQSSNKVPGPGKMLQQKELIKVGTQALWIEQSLSCPGK